MRYGIHQAEIKWRNVTSSIQPEIDDIQYVETFVVGDGYGVVAIRDIGMDVVICNYEAEKLTSEEEMIERSRTFNKILKGAEPNVWWDGSKKRSIGSLINHG